MLVLSRKSQESIVVGGCDGFEHMVKITVVDIKNGSVRLGFDADLAVAIHRWEVWERIMASDPIFESVAGKMASSLREGRVP
jgi:carbon storage regulator CsrA